MQPCLMSVNGVAEDGHGGFNAHGLSVALTVSHGKLYLSCLRNIYTNESELGYYVIREFIISSEQ